MSLNIGELVGYLKLDETAWTKGLVSAKAKMEALGKTDGFKSIDGAVDTSAGKFVFLATRIAALGGGIGVVHQVAAAVVSLSGAAGLVPAAAVAGALAIGTLKLATSGFGKAVKDVGDPKKFAKDLQSLAPAAQADAKEIRALKPQLDGLKKSVQQSLFAGTAVDIKQLGSAYLPVLRTQLSGVAGGWNIAAVSTANYLKQGKQVGLVNTTMTFLETAVNSVTLALQPAVQILLAFVSVGSSRLPGIASSFAAAATRAAAFVQHAKDTGQLGRWIDTALRALGQLRTILGNIIAIVTQVFGAFSGSGASALDTLARLTGTLRTFLASAQGQQALTALASLLGTVSRIVSQVLMVALRQAAPVIIALAPAFAQLAQQAGTALVHALTVAGPLLLDMANWLAQNMHWLGPLIIVLAAGVKAFTLFSKAMSVAVVASRTLNATGKAVGEVGKAVGKIGSFVGKGVGALGRLAGSATSTAAQVGASAARTGAAWVAAGARTVASLAVTAGQFVAQGARMAATAALTAARVVAGWVLMGVQSLINAARMAAAWIIAMGPIGLVIAAVVGLVVLIIANWTKIKNFTIGVWNAIVNWVKAKASQIASWVRARITDVINFFDFLKSLPAKVGAWFEGVRTAAVNRLTSMIDWVKGLPKRILGALGNLGSLLVNAGRNIVQGLWHGITSLAGWLKDRILGWVKSVIPGPIARALGISSPSKVAAELARWVPAGLAAGMDAHSQVAIASARRLAGSVTAALTPAAAGIPTVQLAVNPATATGAQPAGGDRSLVSIANYHPPANASAHDVAMDLDWFSRAGG